MSPEFAYIIGVYDGDGAFGSNSGLCLRVNDKDFANEFIRCILESCDKRVDLILTENYSTKYRVNLNSKYITNKILNYDRSKLFGNKLLAGYYLRAVFDSDGCVTMYPRTNSKGFRTSIHLSSTHKRLIDLWIELLGYLDIPIIKLNTYHTNTGKPYYRINISISEVNVYKFKSLIGFSIERKQKILDKIIEEYKKRGGRCGLVES